MAAVSVLILAGKVLPRGRAVGRVAGLGLLAAGAAVALTGATP